MKNVWTLFIVLVFASCATSGNPSIQDESITKNIIAGKTTKAEVTELLGPPNLTYEANEDGKPIEIWSYAFTAIESNPALYIPVVGLLALTSEDAITSHTKGFSVSFNEQGSVKKVARIDYAEHTGGVD